MITALKKSSSSSSCVRGPSEKKTKYPVKETMQGHLFSFGYLFGVIVKSDNAWWGNRRRRGERKKKKKKKKKESGRDGLFPAKKNVTAAMISAAAHLYPHFFLSSSSFFGLLFASEKRRIMSHRIITATSRQSGGLPGFLLLFPWFSFWAQAPVYCCYSPTLVLHDPGGGDDDDQEAQVAKSRLHVASIDVVFSLLLWVQFLYRLYMALDWCAFLVAKVPPPNNQYVFVPKPT